MNHLDLFSGYGGFHLGLEEAGFKFDNVFYSEIDKHAIANYKYNFPEAHYVGSVTDIQSRDLPRINSISFGSPCQDFSLAGKRKGLEGERSSLIGAAIKLIRELRPDFYIWENVKGVYSSNDGADYWAVKQAFADIDGYRLESQLLNTAWFLPQNRERIYLVGTLATSRRSSGDIFPIGESNQNTNEARRQPGERLLVNCIDANYSKGPDGKRTMIKTVVAGTLRTHKDGEGFRETSSNLCPTIPARAREDGSGQPVIAIGAIRGRNPDNPKSRVSGLETQQMLEKNENGTSNCLTSVQKDNVVIEENNIRRLTEIECERLQGLKDDHTKYGIYDGVKKEIPKTQRYKLCGNGVSIPTVKAVGEAIRKVIND